MGWFSTGYEGKNLNRKLGIYNTSWSSGATLGPLVGGYLTSIDIKLPLASAATMLLLAALMISLSRKPHARKPLMLPIVDGDISDPSLPKFRVAARITLFAGFVCLGLCRAPLGMLMRYELAFTEAHFGMALSIIALMSTVSFFILGKWHAWHYRNCPVFVAQAGLIVALLMIIYSGRLATLYLAAGLMGVFTAYFYTSHMFYGVSATKRRSGAMAVHEIILSAGIGVGAYMGGYLNDVFGRRYAPYMFGLAVIAVSVATQLLLNCCIEKRHSR
jgi:predicted MFS family arabinose efflux permease